MRKLHLQQLLLGPNIPNPPLSSSNNSHTRILRPLPSVKVRHLSPSNPLSAHHPLSLMLSHH